MLADASSVAGLACLATPFINEDKYAGMMFGLHGAVLTVVSPAVALALLSTVVGVVLRLPALYVAAVGAVAFVLPMVLAATDLRGAVMDCVEEVTPVKA